MVSQPMVRVSDAMTNRPATNPAFAAKAERVCRTPSAGGQEQPQVTPATAITRTHGEFDVYRYADLPASTRRWRRLNTGAS